MSDEESPVLKRVEENREIAKTVNQAFVTVSTSKAERLIHDYYRERATALSEWSGTHIGVSNLSLTKIADEISLAFRLNMDTRAMPPPISSACGVG